MTNKILVTLILGFIVRVSFAQKINSSKLDSLFQLLDVNNKFMGSIAIAQNDTIIYSKTIGKADVEANKNATDITKYRIGSISKMFTACLVFKAIEEQRLSLNQTIDKYFSGIENAQQITIQNLLNHTSGIHNFTSDSNYRQYNTQPKTEAEILEIIQNDKTDFVPGTKFAYSNSNYVLLSLILEKIYKKNYSKILQKKILNPVGLKNTYVGNKINIDDDECYSYSFNTKWNKEPETDMSIPLGAGNIVSTPTDLLTVIEYLFEGKIISMSSVNQMKTIEHHYGMGIFQVPFYNKTGYGHNGEIDRFQSVLYYFPVDKVAIAVTSNGQSYSNNNIVIAGLSSYFNKPFKLPDFKNKIKNTEELDQYLGEYSCPELALKITITKDSLNLFAQATGQPVFPLEVIGKNIFEYKVAGIQIEFIPNRKQLILDQNDRKYTFTKN